jgi:hypothetical protein
MLAVIQQETYLLNGLPYRNRLGCASHCLAFFDYSGILQMSGKFPAGWTIGGLR